MLFDTHAHLLDARFDRDRDVLIQELPEKGIGWFTEIAFDMDSSINAAALAAKHYNIYAAVGVHPHEAKTWDDSFARELQSLAGHSKVVAIGEIGLDHHYDFSPRDVQRLVFEAQMQLAQELDMPVVVHSREATQETLEVLRGFPRVKGIWHSFTGSVETLEQALAMGYYAAFNGTVTFKNAHRPVTAAEHVPLERMLLETDCPYMTPVPHRGERNSPEYVGLVAQKIAALRHMELEEIEALTTRNAAEAYRIELE